MRDRVPGPMTFDEVHELVRRAFSEAVERELARNPNAVRSRDALWAVLRRAVDAAWQATDHLHYGFGEAFLWSMYARLEGDLNSTVDQLMEVPPGERPGLLRSRLELIASSFTNQLLGWQLDYDPAEYRSRAVAYAEAVARELAQDLPEDLRQGYLHAVRESARSVAQVLVAAGIVPDYVENPLWADETDAVDAAGYPPQPARLQLVLDPHTQKAMEDVAAAELKAWVPQDPTVAYGEAIKARAAVEADARLPSDLAKEVVDRIRQRVDETLIRYLQGQVRRDSTGFYSQLLAAYRSLPNIALLGGPAPTERLSALEANRVLREIELGVEEEIRAAEERAMSAEVKDFALGPEHTRTIENEVLKSYITAKAASLLDFWHAVRRPEQSLSPGLTAALSLAYTVQGGIWAHDLAQYSATASMARAQSSLARANPQTAAALGAMGKLRALVSRKLPGLAKGLGYGYRAGIVGLMLWATGSVIAQSALFWDWISDKVLAESSRQLIRSWIESQIRSGRKFRSLYDAIRAAKEELFPLLDARLQADLEELAGKLKPPGEPLAEVNPLFTDVGGTARVSLSASVLRAELEAVREKLRELGEVIRPALERYGSRADTILELTLLSAFNLLASQLHEAYGQAVNLSAWWDHQTDPAKGGLLTVDGLIRLADTLASSDAALTGAAAMRLAGMWGGEGGMLAANLFWTPRRFISTGIRDEEILGAVNEALSMALWDEARRQGADPLTYARASAVAPQELFARVPRDQLVADFRAWLAERAKEGAVRIPTTFIALVEVARRYLMEKVPELPKEVLGGE